MLYYVDERTYFDKQDHYYGACPEGFRHFLESIFWGQHSYYHVFMIFIIVVYPNSLTLIPPSVKMRNCDFARVPGGILREKRPNNANLLIFLLA